MESRDCISLVASNMDESTYLLCTNQDMEIVLPSTKLARNSSARQTLRNLFSEMMGSEMRSASLMYTCRTWQGMDQPPGNHLVFYVQTNKDAFKKKLTGRETLKSIWKTQAEISRMTEFASPEVGCLFNTPAEKERALISALESTASVIGPSMVEVLRDHLIVTDAPKTVFEHLLANSTWSEQDMVSILSDFWNLCSPYVLMGLAVFRKFAVNNMGHADEHAAALFRAGDLSGKGALSFKEFMYLMVLVEPSNQSQPASVEAQARLIFRYFDSTKKGFWSATDVERFISEVRKKRKNDPQPLPLDKDIAKFYRDLEVQPGDIQMLLFVKSVTSGKFKHPPGFMKNTKRLLDILPGKKTSQMAVSDKAGERTAPTYTEPAGDVAKAAPPKGYTFASHVIKIGKTGYIDFINFDTLKKCMTPSAANVGVFANKKSQTNFSQTNPANEVLVGLRYFALTNSIHENKQKEPFTWEKVEYLSLGKLLINLSLQVEDIFKNEPRLLQVPEPAYILGDIHGNFTDLFLFEAALWGSGVHLAVGSILFLGDYVDRGPDGVEVVCYLFASKIKSPNRLFMVRGNHEIRTIQKQFTFFNECMKKFGKEFGQDVWKAVNNAFDAMPLAAVVDNELFCCHGGVPPPWLCPSISVINSIPVPLPNPEVQSALAWELLWNDPVRDDMLNDAVMVELSMNDGFAVNKRRGTAHMFNSAALSKFLKVNRLSYAIRAHEVVDCGFRLQQGSKLATIFSTSYYSGMTNQAACILVQDGKMRLMILQTDEFHKADMKQQPMR